MLRAFVVSRAILLYVTAVYAFEHGTAPVQTWNRWDAHWYIGIATHSYWWTYQIGKPSLAFFPLYPASVHVAISAGIPGVLAGLLISNIAFAAALFYVFALVRQHTNAVVAGRAVLLLSLFPAALFTFAPYSESLFLLCAAATLYHARRGQALFAGVALGAALLTRPTGVILVLPALVFLWPLTPGKVLRCLLPALAAGVTYALYLKSVGFEVGAVLRAQEAWHRSLTWPWTGFTTSLDWLRLHGSSNLGWSIENAFSLLVVVAFLMLTIAAWRSLPPAIALYCAGFWITVLCSPQWEDGYYAPFSSAIRFVLVLFPLAGWAAARLGSRAFTIVTAISAVLLAVAASIHVAGGWVG